MFSKRRNIGNETRMPRPGLEVIGGALVLDSSEFALRNGQ